MGERGSLSSLFVLRWATHTHCHIVNKTSLLGITIFKPVQADFLLRTSVPPIQMGGKGVLRYELHSSLSGSLEVLVILQSTPLFICAVLVGMGSYNFWHWGLDRLLHLRAATKAELGLMCKLVVAAVTKSRALVHDFEANTQEAAQLFCGASGPIPSYVKMRVISMFRVQPADATSISRAIGVSVRHRFAFLLLLRLIRISTIFRHKKGGRP
mmetsp:Transcript_22401/g.49071  ORF Transcript_22401/g.49071 Transcript_22401/m.49071 type:complete len:212 (-) Transcript_22401:758-1393(-)